jgi:hypothetical protein
MPLAFPGLPLHTFVHHSIKIWGSESLYLMLLDVCVASLFYKRRVGLDHVALAHAEALVFTARAVLVWNAVRATSGVTSRNLAEDLPSRNLHPS